MSKEAQRAWPNAIEAALGDALEWSIQRWVAWSERKVRTAESSWLEGPVGEEHIGAEFCEAYARETGLETVTDDEDAGLSPNFDALASEGFDPSGVRPEIRNFYEHMARYDFSVRIGWSGPLRHPPRTLIYLVGRNIGQFDILLSAPSVVMENELIRLQDPVTNEAPYAGWLRRSAATGEAMLAPVFIQSASYRSLTTGSSRVYTRCQEVRRRRSSARRTARTAPSRSSPMAGASEKQATTASTARKAARCA